MSTASTVVVQVPATTSNLGAGFDCIGAAFTLHNRFEYQVLTDGDPVTIAVIGAEAARVKTDSSNLAYQSYRRLYQQIGQAPPAVKITIALGVPLSRGLGSSATAIVGGLVGANALAGSPLSQAELMQLAIAIEGHPDNVVPALLGGCQLAIADASQRWMIADVVWNHEVVPVVAVPDFEVSTAEARRVLPTQYSRADAIFNMAHLGLLIRGLETGRDDWLRVALDDRIHQPYRQSLIQGYEAVRSAALQAGAYGVVISGAGPTLLALTHTTQAGAVETAMRDVWTQQGIVAEVKPLHLNAQGAQVIEHT